MNRSTIHARRVSPGGDSAVVHIRRITRVHAAKWSFALAVKTAAGHGGEPGEGKIDQDDPDAVWSSVRISASPQDQAPAGPAAPGSPWPGMKAIPRWPLGRTPGRRTGPARHGRTAGLVCREPIRAACALGRLGQREGIAEGDVEDLTAPGCS
jgi:hypothetical protein